MNCSEKSKVVSWQFFIPLTSKTAPEGTTWFNKFSEKQVSKQRNSQISPEVDDTADDEDTNQINNEKRPSATDLWETVIKSRFSKIQQNEKS